ncbi:N-acetyltransferase 9-like protein [Cimex lectularius]|uniref:N-acetyltransferase domain-containing protein n=1 Tax=Cimex lectularius TaxID=79782 RepID=A0A8I6S5X5_CIMLE|nr:N-acetyltransferase 9-like protein [Cimex lectularius]
MRLNISTKIVGNKVILVPYRISHVEKYHKWMEDEDLRLQTASDRLTLHEEYEMQQTWLNDVKKCTFIVLDKETMLETNDEVESMIGDANVYLKDSYDGLVGEIGLMIAEPKFRGKGMGREVALLIMRYAVTAIKVKKFEAIVSLNNENSIKMFNSLNFQEESKSTFFKEITLVRQVDEEFTDYLFSNTKEYNELPTEENK